MSAGDSPDLARLFRVVNAAMAVLFGYSMAVQHNDPDAANWMAAYGVAMVLCVSAVLDRPRWRLSALLSVLAAVGAASVAPGVPVGLGLQDSEQGRELMGMLLVCGWMGVLTWWWRQEPPRPTGG